MISLGAAFAAPGFFIAQMEVSTLWTHETTPPRPASPFDDSARERLRRMGLIDADGKPQLQAIAVAARLYAGLYYDELCDYFSNLAGVKAVCRDLSEQIPKKDARSKFLAICTAYDAIYHVLPEPVWWMAGSMELVAPFTDGFLRRMAELADEMEVM